MAAEVLQQLNFAQGALGENFLAEDIGDLLDSDTFGGLVVDGSAVGPDEAGHSSVTRNGGVGNLTRKMQSATRRGESPCLPDNAVGALAQLLGDGISLVDDEVLVKDLEDLPSLEVAHGGWLRIGAEVRRYGGERAGSAV